MPSARRLRVLSIVVVAGLITIFFTSRLRQGSVPDAGSPRGFYDKTKSAIERAQSGGQAVLEGSKAGSKGAGHHLPLDKDADGDVDDDDNKLTKEVTDRLKAAEQQAKELANSKSPNKPDAPSNVIGVGSSAGGQRKKTEQAKDRGRRKDVDTSPDATGGAEIIEESPEDRRVGAELNAILKRSPVIIFSKSYCPYSKRAKGVLLDKYVIDPPPNVVELDTHPLGPQIQARLAALTGLKTVPNIMVNGKSIGGSDDIAELDKAKLLVAKIGSLGGKQVSMKERFAGVGGS